MAYTDEDLKEMMDDCIRQVKELGYDVFPIVDIKFSPGSRCGFAYLRSHKDMDYDMNTKTWKNVAFCIRVHSFMKDLSADDYMEIKAVVMHEVIHAIKPHDGVGFPYLSHGDIFIRTKNEVEAAYGYKHIWDSTKKERVSEKLVQYFHDYYKKKA